MLRPAFFRINLIVLSIYSFSIFLLKYIYFDKSKKIKLSLDMDVIKDKEKLYRLIVGQLQYDGYVQVSKNLLQQEMR